VLWDAAVTGSEYILELAEWHEEKQFFFLNRAEKSNEQVELLGFGLHEALLADLGGLDLLGLKRKPARRVLILENAATNGSVRPDLARFYECVKALGAEVDYLMIESFRMWTEDPDKGLVPQQVIEAAVTWLAQDAA